MKIILFLAQGFEEVEALTSVDLLRRVGISVDMVSISDVPEVEGAHSIKVVANRCIGDVSADEYDGCILPGGSPGFINLGESHQVKNIVDILNKEKKLVAAICAAPSVLEKFHILEGKTICLYPGMEKNIHSAKVVFEPVVVCENIITSRGVGTAIDFALAIVEYMIDSKTAKTLCESIVANK